MKNTKKKNGAAAKGKGRATLSAQQTIPYLSMHPDGVCKLPGGLYTKTVEYEDINYSVPIPAAAIKSISRKRMTTITASGTSLPGC